jgi:hypothetical protein
MKPTDDDLKRDAAADLAVCEAATPGPWQRRDREIVDARYHFCTEIEGNPVIWQGKQEGATPVCKLYSGFVWFEGDCAFVPMARTALPAWIRRARAAEAEVARLRAALLGQNHEIEQTLGKALGYPPLYPDASPVDDGQACVGDHVAETLALEAADLIERLRAERKGGYL